MSDYTNFIEQHSESCDICQKLLTADDIPDGKRMLDKHLQEVTDKADTQFQAQFQETETLCGNPHNNGDNEPENCIECMTIKLNV